MYKVKYHKQVIKFLQKQDKKTVKSVIGFFDEIKKDLNFKNHNVKPLKGFNGFYRLRISKYRVVFEIKNDVLLINVIKAGSRGDVYK
jgi:mRNA interferase RelE/StbE